MRLRGLLQLDRQLSLYDVHVVLLLDLRTTRVAVAFPALTTGPQLKGLDAQDEPALEP